MGTVELDDAVMRSMVAAVVARRPDAWTDLISWCLAHIEHLTRTSRFLGPLRDSDDHRRAVVTEVIAKLARNEHRALELLEPWLQANPGKTSGDWLRIVVTNVARSYVTSQLGAGTPAAGVAGASAKKRLLHTLATALPADGQELGARPPVTDQQTAREVLAYAAEHLPREQLLALTGWLQHGDFVEIGRAAGEGEQAARVGERLVRAALARLRRRFALDPDA